MTINPGYESKSLRFTQGERTSSGRWISRDPITEKGGINLYDYVLDNPVNLWDPLGLWQFTLYGGDVLGGYISFGWNSGQWNLSLRGGVGEGLSGSLDFSDSGCKKSGWNPITAAGSVGAGLFGAGGEVGESPDGMYGSVNERTLFSSVGGSVSVSEPRGAPTFRGSGGFGNWGVAGFIGTGYTWTW